MKKSREDVGEVPVQSQHMSGGCAPGKRTRIEARYGTAGQAILRQAQSADAPSANATDHFANATRGAGGAVPHKQEMESAFAADFGGVTAYLGQQDTLDQMNANAATSGESIAFATTSPSRELVAHELTHVLQQRRSGGSAAQRKAAVSSPGDAAEREADHVAADVVAGKSVTVSETAPPVIHRDIKGGDDVPMGRFDIDFKKVETVGGKTGEDGNITFTPNEKAPDSKSIRLSQAVKTSKVSDKKDVDWATLGTGKEGDRDKMRTAGKDATHTTRRSDTLKSLALKYYGDPSRHGEIYNANKDKISEPDPNKRLAAGLTLKIPNAVEGGYFIDHLADDPRAKKRTSKTDPEVPQDYVWPGEESTTNKHGSKRGKTIKPAMLDDFPGTSHDWLFNFETVARSEDAGIYYGTIHWDFKVNNDKVSEEAYRVTPGVSGTFRAALDEFNKFYDNPHTVMKGETLWAIANKYYGDGSKWPAIYKANKDKIKDPDHIEPGWKLQIPRTP